MESMIERVGRAIFASQDWPEFHPAYENSAKEVWEVAAKEAIMALREPSELMLKASQDVLFSPGVTTPERERQIGDLVFKYMIDAALKEE